MDNDQDLPKEDDGAVKLTRFGILIAACVFGGLAIWSIAAPVDSAVLAPGQITVESNRKTIQHLEGGVVREILVREGDAVEAGQLLMRLDDTVSRTNVQLLNDQLAENIARNARLIAERDGMDEIPANSRALAITPDDLDVSTYLEGQRGLLAARKKTRDTQISLLEERALQQETRIDGFGTQLRSQRAQSRLIADELSGVKKLNAEGYAPMTRVRALEREVEEISGREGSLTASIAEAESIISETRLEIERLKQQSREDAIDASQTLSVEIAGLSERRVAALEALARTEVRAPQSGTVLGLEFHTVGGVVPPGGSLMEIVPQNDRLVISAQIAPQDVDKVRAGQEAIIRFAALNARLTPEATGTVRRVSADNIVDNDTGATYYLVLIDLPKDEELESILKGQELLPGMPTESFIRTGSQPAINYLLKPLTDAFSRALREE